MNNTKNTFDSLSQERQDLVSTMVETIMTEIKTIDDVGVEHVDMELLLATLEKLNAEKKLAKEQAEIDAKAEKKIKQAEAVANGAKLAQGISVGDTIVFTMGSGNNVKTMTKTVLKVGEKTCTIELTDEEKGSAKTNKRFIKFEKISEVIKAEVKAVA